MKYRNKILYDIYLCFAWNQWSCGFGQLLPKSSRKSIQMLKLPAAHETIKALVEAIRRFSVVCQEHKYHTVFSHGTKQTGVFLDKWMQKKQFLLSFGEIWLWQHSIFIKRYMFYFHWQTIFQTVREKIKIYGDRRRRNTTRSIWPSLHMVTPISDLLSMQPSLNNSFAALTPTCLSHCLIFHWFLPMFSLACGKMSCERQIPLLKHDVHLVMQYWGVDNSITVAAIQARVLTRLVTTWSHLATGDDKAALLLTDGYIASARRGDRRECAAGHCLVLMCELCHLCLSDNPRSILHQRAFFLPSADLLFLGAKD